MTRALLDVEQPMDLVVVAGRNEQVRKQLLQLPTPHPSTSFRVLGFTDEMDQWLAVAELVVSKPGGLTTSEALARGAIMVVVNPIPGAGNAEQRLLARKRSRHQGQQYGHAHVQGKHTAVGFRLDATAPRQRAAQFPGPAPPTMWWNARCNSWLDVCEEGGENKDSV